MRRITLKHSISVVVASAVLAALFSSCSNTKKLPQGEALYTGATISIRDRNISAKKRKALKKDLATLARPKPNSKFLGMRLKLLAYNLAGNPKKETGFRGWLKYKVGEPPVLLSQVNLNKNVQVQESYLQNKGYFKADVRADSTVKNKKMAATYSARPRQLYTINEVVFLNDSSELNRNIQKTIPQTLLRKDDPFDLDIIKLERTRIDAYLKENGYYFFNPDYMLVQVDSTIGNNKVNLYVKVKPVTPEEARNIYRIRNVFIFTNYSVNTQSADTIKATAQYYKGYYLVDRRKTYKPLLFEQSMQFDPGDVYNRTDHNATLSRLINLNLFKFVKNRFEVVENADSSQLDVYYYLTRFPKKSLRIEINGNTKSNNLTGSEISIALRNRNSFGAGELFTVKATGGFEIQYSGQFRGYNTYRAGLETSLTFPRFLVPFFNPNTKGGFAPKTTMMLAYDLLRKQKLYTLNSFKAQFGYAWKENIRKEHQLNPISINYVQPIDVSDEYIDSANKNKILYKAIEKQFVIGPNYSFTYTNLINNRPANGIYFFGGIDLSGNIPGLITGANAKINDTATIFHARFSQYVKTEADFRFYRKTGDKTVWANRINIGIGIPNGNSLQLPFIKQFFSGGNTSIRAFRSRSVGPGTFQDTTTTFLADESGDMKLELNTEWRFPIYKIVNGAVFVDAGNIWLFNEDTLRPGGKFSKDFLHELAVGTGLGIRLDFTLLILRLDVAFPLRKPYLPAGQRWITNKIDFGSSQWRKSNLVWNLAIGFPF